MLPAGPTPQDKAERNLIWAKSQEGWIYANELSLYAQLVATGTSGDYADDDLWMAQVGLWIQKDIAEAINDTNEQAQQSTLVDNAKGVPSSAVKRLVGTRIRGYVLRGGAGSSAGSSPGAGPAGSAMGASSAGTEGGIVYLALPSGSAGPPTLTGRACNKLYDVVHYDFTVIIPAAYLRRLYENLRLQNFHTVIDVVITVPGTETETGRGAATARAQGDPYRYYGTGPVVQATIVGELLLLTEWTRGRWDANKKIWDKDYPPLVPEQFLAKISRDPEALREEDKTRIGGALAAPTRRAGPMPGPRPGPAQYQPQDNIRYEH